MDEYQCCTLEDAKDLAKKLLLGESVLFPFSGDSVTCHIIFISPAFDIIGTMPFAGSPRGCYCVGILRQGFFHFDFKKYFHGDYVGEKLNLPDPDAKQVAEMLQAISDHLPSDTAIQHKKTK